MVNEKKTRGRIVFDSKEGNKDMRTSVTIATLLLATALAPTAQAQNLVPANWSLISWPGGDGTLRPNSGWEAGSTNSDVVRIVDGVFAPESQQWNNGSFWWDETQTVSPYYTTVVLNGSYAFDRVVLQADNNDNYLVEYFDGANWQNAFTAAAVGGYGLTTRDSGRIGSFTTDRFRLSAFGGDAFYSMSEFQAFAAVPEPATWALMILGFGAIGGTLRRRSAKVRYA